MSTQAAAECLSALAAVYAKTPFGDDDRRAEVWIRMLRDLPDESLKVATARLAATKTWCPSVAELRAEVAALHDDTPSGADAWGEVLRNLSRVGHTGTPTWSTPLIAEALRGTVPWSSLCSATHDSMPSHRARFLEAYDGIRRRHSQHLALPPSARLELKPSTGHDVPRLDHPTENRS